MLLSFLWLLLMQVLVSPTIEPMTLPDETVAVVVEEAPLGPEAPAPDPEPASEPTLEPAVTPVAPTPAPTPEPMPAPRDCKWYNPPDNGMYTYDEWCDQALWVEAHPLSSNYDYIRMFAGVCPSQQDAPRILVDSLGYEASLGLLSPYRTVNYYVEQYWAYGKRELMPSDTMSYLPNDVPARDANGNFMYTWSTLTVTWEGQPSSAMDAEAAQMTQYLRSLDARYNIACPND